MFSRDIASPEAVVDVTDDLDGVAIWYPPGRYPEPGEDATPAARAGSSALLEAIETARPPGRFWFLAFLGARTPGRGAGSALVRHRLARITGSSALWTGNEANLDFYARFGFRAESLHEAPGACAFWLIRGSSDTEPSPGDAR
jgi:GNAT superfamily N-acetyltransferase